MTLSCRFLIFLSCFQLACQLTGSAKYLSSWDKLTDAKSVDCQEWPMTGQEMEIMEVHPIDFMKNYGFLVNGRWRDGSLFHYTSRLDDDEIAEDSRSPLTLGFGTEMIGSFPINGEIVALLEVIGKNGKKSHEIRDLKTNVIRYKSEERSDNFRSRFVVPDSKGFWLAYQMEAGEESIEDQPHQFMRIEWNDKGKLITTDQTKLKVIGDIGMVGSQDAKALVVWLDTGTSEIQKSPKFNYFILEKGKDKIKVKSLDVEIADRIESWRVQRNEAGVVLAYITGDTLLWENASLLVMRISDAGDILQSNKFAISNEHVGDPHLVNSGSSIYLVLSKWLDHESSVAIYKISSSDVENLGYFGVFKEGTYLQQSFYSPYGEKLFFITQAPSGYMKRYSYCAVSF